MVILQPFQSIRSTSAVVNLPESVLRRGCRNGTIPHIRHNNRIYIDIPALLDQMDADNGEKPLTMEKLERMPGAEDICGQAADINGV